MLHSEVYITELELPPSSSLISGRRQSQNEHRSKKNRVVKTSRLSTKLVEKSDKNLSLKTIKSRERFF